MRHFMLAVLVATTSLAAACSGAKTDAAKASAAPTTDSSGFKTEDEKTLYAMGFNIGKGNFSRLGTSQAESEAFAAGVRDGMMAATSKVDLATADPKIQELLKNRSEKAAAAVKAKGAEFQKAAAAEPDAVKLASGVVYRTISPGTGKSPSRMDSVRVNYVGTLTDGTKFDASASPTTFELGRVVPCFSEGITRMKTGEKARLVCPPETAYGDRDNGPIPGGSTLVFDIELLEVVAGKPVAQR